MKTRKSVILVLTVALILLIVCGTILLGYATYWGLTYILGYQPSTNLSNVTRLPGLVILAAGVIVILDVMRYRRPFDILVSTSDTFAKLIRRTPFEQRTMRTEPFIPKGPYVYVRNPMYLAVVMFAFGFGLSLSSTPLLLWGLEVTCWFWFFQIPVEEKELHALFGETYAQYRRQVPKLFPYGKSYKPHEVGPSKGPSPESTD